MRADSWTHGRAGSANPTQEHLRTHQNNWSIDSSVEVCLVVSGIPRNRGDGTTEWHRRFLRFKLKITILNFFGSEASHLHFFISSRRRRRSSSSSTDNHHYPKPLSITMRVTRLLEGASSETHATISQDQFVSLVAKHKALLLQCDEGSDPLSVDDFAEFMESLQLQHYEYVGGAGESIRALIHILFYSDFLLFETILIFFTVFVALTKLLQHRDVLFQSKPMSKSTPPTRHLQIN